MKAYTIFTYFTMNAKKLYTIVYPLLVKCNDNISVRCGVIITSLIITIIIKYYIGEELNVLHKIRLNYSYAYIVSFKTILVSRVINIIRDNQIIRSTRICDSGLLPCHKPMSPWSAFFFLSVNRDDDARQSGESSSLSISALHTYIPTHIIYLYDDHSFRQLVSNVDDENWRLRGVYNTRARARAYPFV